MSSISIDTLSAAIQGNEETKNLRKGFAYVEAGMRAKDGDIEGLAREMNKHPAVIQTLVIDSHDPSAITDKSAEALATTPLKNLIIRQSIIGDQGAKALAAMQLDGLALRGTVGNEGAKALAPSNLRSLALHCQIGDEGAEALAANPTLECLSLKGNQIGDRGAAALARNPNLKILSLENNDIGDEGATAFLQNTTLTHLQLGDNKISEALLTEIENHITQNRNRSGEHASATQTGPGTYTISAIDEPFSQVLVGRGIGREGVAEVTERAASR